MALFFFYNERVLLSLNVKVIILNLKAVNRDTG